MTQAWYPFFWADYSGKTFHLTQGQHGAYMLLLRYVYTTGGPIPDEHRYSIAKALLEQEQQNTDFVLASFFRREGACWHNDRAESVISDAEAKHAKRVTAGKRGGKQKSSNARAMLKQSRSKTVALPTQPEPDSNTPLYPPAFDALWAIFPKQRIGNRARACAAWKRAVKRAPAETIHAGAGAYAGSEEVAIGRAKGLAAWLNDDRWACDYRRDGQPAAAAGWGSFRP